MSRTPRRQAFRPQGESLESRNLMAVFTVTSTEPWGVGSLNHAINLANQSRGPDTIRFQLPVVSGSSPYFGVLIEPPGGYAPIAGKVTIDGFTQPLSQPNTSTNAAVNNAVYQVNIVSTGHSPIMTVAPSGSGTEIRGIAFIGQQSREITGLVIDRANSVKVDGDLFTTIERASLNPSIRIVGGSQNAIGGAVAVNPALQNVMTGYNTSMELTAGSKNNAIFGNLIGGQPSATAQQNIGVLLHPGADNNALVGNVLVRNLTAIFNAGTANILEGNIVVPR